MGTTGSPSRKQLPAHAAVHRKSFRVGMETSSGKEAINVLRRLIAYSEKIFALSADILTQVSDRRLEPRIPAAAVVKSALACFIHEE